MTDNETREGVLGIYEGRPIDGSTLTIRNTGHGFEPVMAVDPVRLPLHGKVYLIIEADVEKHRFDPIDDSDGLTLVNMLKAERSTIVDRGIVEKYLDDQERRIQEAKGEPMIEFPEDDDEGHSDDPDEGETQSETEDSADTPEDGFGLYGDGDEDES